MAIGFLSFTVVQLQGFLDALRARKSKQHLVGFTKFSELVNLDFGHIHFLLYDLGVGPNCLDFALNRLELAFLVFYWHIYLVHWIVCDGLQLHQARPEKAILGKLHHRGFHCWFVAKYNIGVTHTIFRTLYWLLYQKDVCWPLRPQQPD